MQQCSAAPLGNFKGCRFIKSSSLSHQNERCGDRKCSAKMDMVENGVGPTEDSIAISSRCAVGEKKSAILQMSSSVPGTFSLPCAGPITSQPAKPAAWKLYSAHEQ